jgi:hypothetical protein
LIDAAISVMDVVSSWDDVAISCVVTVTDCVPWEICWIAVEVCVAAAAT